MRGYLYCTECRKRFSEDATVWQCSCGGLLNYKNLLSFKIEKVKKTDNSLWRYSHALPISSRNKVSFGEGWTPLQEVEVQGHPVLFKFDHIFPSGSYKDRGATVLVSKIRELGISEIVEDSSGNAGASIASYCAKAKIKSNILVPASNSDSKLKQIASTGAELIAVKGSRQDVADLAIKLAEKTYYASHSYNPFFFEGTKTFAFEIVEQLGWRAPDTVILPVGNGTLLLGAYIGFEQLRKSGIISKCPKIIAVQAKACDPLARSFEHAHYKKLEAVQIKQTLAEGIAISKPVRGLQILQAVAKTSGKFITVSEQEIENSWQTVKESGIYIEPTAAVSYAGLNSYLQNKNSRQELIVCVFTGHGLKK